MTSNLKTKTLTLLLLIIACGIAVYFGYNQYQKLEGSKALLDQALAEQKKLKEASDQITKFLEEYVSLSSEQAEANTALPVGSPASATALAQIDKLAKSSGLLIGSISIRERNADVKIAENGIDYQDIEMELSGSYPAFRNFLLLTETNLRLMDIQSLSSQAEDENLIKYKLVIRSYYQK